MVILNEISTDDAFVQVREYAQTHDVLNVIGRIIETRAKQLAMTKIF